MDFSSISDSDLFGRYFFKKPLGAQYSGYYETLSEARTLFSNQHWLESVTGFYVNVDGNFDSVRTSYFTRNAEAVSQIVNDFLISSCLVTSQQAETPKKTRISDPYGGDELRFRRYLSTYTVIGLELMQSDRLYIQRLFATFRFQIFPQGPPFNSHFESTFERESETYRSFDDNDKKQFWVDFSSGLGPGTMNWAHMMVNMVLAGDWPPDWPPPHQMFTSQQINKITRQIGFEIPDDWVPT